MVSRRFVPRKFAIGNLKAIDVTGNMRKKTEQSSVQMQIDENLKKVYQETLQEDIPDRFRDLLAQLKEKDRAAAGNGEPE